MEHFGNRMRRDLTDLTGSNNGSAAEDAEEQPSPQRRGDAEGSQRTAENCTRRDAFPQRAGIFCGTAARDAPCGLPSGGAQKKIRARGGPAIPGVQSSAFPLRLRASAVNAVVVSPRRCRESCSRFTPTPSPCRSVQSVKSASKIVDADLASRQPECRADLSLTLRMTLRNQHL